MRFTLPALLFVALLTCCGAAPAEMPRVLDDRLAISLFALAPDIVHPVAATFDKRGRLIVIESHTHFRPQGYQGPAHDRLRMIVDSNGDGQADKFATFFEGTDASMDLATHADGSIYLATRSEILRLEDTDDDGRADKQTTIIKLDTAGKYPHNGLSGLVFDHEGNLYFGLGENLGERYTLTGADGAKIADGGEGGNVFWCTARGEKLRRVATGFWNPFGATIDSAGRMFVVDNDPDSAPPCRMLHVVDGGDYGYLFRYGRTGRHPFQSWNGQLTGTLPYMSGTGEAPCEIISYAAGGLPADYVGDLLVTAWGDHRLERYRIEPRGASWSAKRLPMIQGGSDFRPVGLAVAPDGSLYLTDWVLRDYNLHGRGAIWHVRMKQPETRTLATGPQRETSTPASRARDAIATLDGPTGLVKLGQSLGDDDPFIRQAAVQRLATRPELLHEMKKPATERQAIGWLLAQRAAGTDPGQVLPGFLTDRGAVESRIVALKWVSDLRLDAFRSQVEQIAAEPGLTVPVLYCAITTLARLDGQPADEGKLHDALLTRLEKTDTPADQVIAALRLVPATHKRLNVKLLSRLLASPNPAVRSEVVRTLAEHPDPARVAVLRGVATDAANDVQLRADAIAGLAGTGAETTGDLLTWAESSEPELRDEAIRALYGVSLSSEQLSRLDAVATQAPEVLPLVERLRGKTFAAGRPDPKEVAAWLAALDGGASVEAGRRLFFHNTVTGCAKCHRVDGHGAAVGPELSGVSQQGRSRVVMSVVQPSAEIAPQYQAWVMATTDGRTLTGFLIHTHLDEVTYIDQRGERFKLNTQEIEETVPAPISIMPAGLLDRLTDQEIRDLFAFLLRRG